MRLRITLAFVLILGALALGRVFMPAAHAADIRTGDRVVIEADEVIDDDLIVTAQLVQIDGTVTGDLIATGNSVVMNGTVGGSAMLAGQTVEVSGQVDGSLYVGAYALVLDEGAVITRNAFVGGFSIATRTDSQVGRALYATGYQVLHDGLVGRDLVVSSNALHLNGIVNGNVRGEVAAAGDQAAPSYAFPGMPANLEIFAPGLVVGSTAQIGGQMLAQEIAPTTAPRRGFFGLPLWLSENLGQFFGLLLVGLIIVALAPRFLPALSDALQRNPLPSLGWGVLIYLLLFPAALFVGLVLIVLLALLAWAVSLGQYTSAVLGLTVGFYLFTLFAFLFFVYIVAWLILGHWLGGAILNRLGLNPAGRLTQYAYVFLGVLFFQVVRAVPVLGTILAFVVGSLALGTALVGWLERRRRGKAVVTA